MITISEQVKEFVAPVNNILFYYGIPITILVISILILGFFVYKIYNNTYIKKHHRKKTYKDIMGDCDADIINQALRECRRKANN